MDELTLAQKLLGKEKTTEDRSELVNPSTASIVYMIAVTASSNGEVVLRDEIEESAEWEEGDFTEVDEDGDFEEYEPDDDPMEDVDDTVVDMTDGDGVDIEESSGTALAYTVADYHGEAVAAYAMREGEAEEDSLPDENTTIDDVIDDGDAETIPDVGALNEDALLNENAVIDEISDADYTLTDDNSYDLSDEIEGAEVSDGYTVAECIGAVKQGDRVAVMVQNGNLTVIGVVGSGDEMEALREQAEEAADEASEAAADAQAKAEQAQQQAAGAAQDATEAKEQAEAANTAANNAHNAANEAANEAGEALQKANDAKAKADAVEENMAEVNAEIGNVKESAAKMRSDLEAEIQTVKTTMSATYATKTDISTAETTLRKELSESIAGIESTFAQDYAKKTELDDAIVSAKATLQSQITQNANAITLAVKSVEDVQAEITSQDGKIAAAQKAAADAQSVATQAKTDASEAQTAATNAQTQAQAANAAATQAQTEANEAKSKADAAQSLADSAKTDLATAKAKLAEVESNVAASAEDIAEAQQAVANAQAAVNTAQAAADKAKVDAAAAQSTADAAKTSANAANSAATQAQTKANEAKAAADKAQQSADEAKDDLAALEGRVTTAETAIQQNSDAIALRATKTEVTALAERVSAAEQKITADAIISTVSGTYLSKTDASNAYSTKTEVTQTADGLETKITTAQNNAAKTATNFMSYDTTNGLLIGNKSSGSWSGSKAQILPSAFNILTSDGNILASYQANRIDLGMNSDATVINLCGGIGTIKSTESGSGWDRMTIEAGDSIDLNTTGQIVLGTAWDEGVGKKYSSNYIALTSKRGWYNTADANKTELIISSKNYDGEIEYFRDIYLQGDSIKLQAEVHGTNYSRTASITMQAGETEASCRIEATNTWFSGSISTYGDVSLKTTNRSIIATDTNGAERRLLTLNNNNNCVINYDSYVNKNGDTNIYADTINMYSNNYIRARQTMLFGNTKGIRAYMADETTTAVMMYTNASDNLYIGDTVGFGTMYFRTTSFAMRMAPPSDTTYNGHFIPSTDAKTTLGTSSNRWYRLYQSHASVSLSDERDKENIVPLGASPVMTLSLDDELSPNDIHSELFDRLLPVQYNYRNADTKICYGLIAQQVESVMQELGIGENELDLVHHDSWIDEETGEEKDTYGIAYENIIALLIHEVQKLKKQIS